jgi:hypothetical protein
VPSCPNLFAGETIREWQGKTAMRISVSSWATTEADVDRSLEAMARIARALVGKRGWQRERRVHNTFGSTNVACPK